MPRRPRPERDVVALLEHWLARARIGDLAEVYLMGREKHGEWIEAYHTNDLDDMAFELRSASLRARAEK